MTEGSSTRKPNKTEVRLRTDCSDHLGRNAVFPRRATGPLASGIHRHLAIFRVESAAGAALGEERFDSGLGHQTFIFSLKRPHVAEAECGCGGSNKALSVERDPFGQNSCWNRYRCSSDA